MTIWRPRSTRRRSCCLSSLGSSVLRFQELAWGQETFRHLLHVRPAQGYCLPWDGVNPSLQWLCRNFIAGITPGPLRGGLFQDTWRVRPCNSSTLVPRLTVLKQSTSNRSSEPCRTYSSRYFAENWHSFTAGGASLTYPTGSLGGFYRVRRTLPLSGPDVKLPTPLHLGYTFPQHHNAKLQL